MIKIISFETIYLIWKNYLWQHRVDKIETHSAMLLNESFDIKNFNYNPTFFGYYLNENIVGVNSGHKCCDNTYRSRGLYVIEEYRNRGIGKVLLQSAIEQARKEDCHLIWSYPRINSWKTYKSVGFKLVTEWKNTENGKNAFCTLNIGAGCENRTRA